MLKYRRGGIASTTQEQSEIIERESARERALRAAGCDVFRVTWSDVIDSGVLARLTDFSNAIARRREALRSGGAVFQGFIRAIGPLLQPPKRM